ncbi:Ig-like domain-containing protein, partial [Cribrihabitans sp. XS_ASV171]
NANIQLVGYDGNDSLIGGGGDDDFLGGDGIDVAVVADAGGAAYDTLGIDVSGVTASGGAASGVLIGPDGTETLDDIEVIKVANTGSSTFIVVDGMSIQAAVDAAGNGDTIVVEPGTYVEDVTIPVGLTGLTIMGAFDGTDGSDAARDLMGGAGESTLQGRLVILGDDATVDGMRFAEGSGGGAFELATIHVQASNANISNSVFYRSGAVDGDTSRGVINSVGNGDGMSVTNNAFSGFHTGTYVQGADDVTVDGNDFTNNLVGVSADAYPTGNQNLAVTNNLFDNTLEDMGLGSAGGSWSGTSTIDGNTFNKGFFDYDPADNSALLGTNTFVPGAVTVSSSDSVYTSIQEAVDNANPGDTITVGAGTYDEDVVIDKALTLISTDGAASTIINGQNGALGAIEIDPGVSDVTIGGTGQGFTVQGNNGNGAIENAAIYIQGTGHDNITIQGNIIEARGDAGLMNEYGGTLTNSTIDGNEFTGVTYTGPNPEGVGSSGQFDVGNNVPRQLVVLGNGGGDALSANVTGLAFTNNTLSGTTGGLNISGDSQGNFLATIDAAGSVIDGNLFTGTGGAWYQGLRVRRPDTDITNNTFDNSTGGDSRGVSLANQNGTEDMSGNSFIGGTDGDLFYGTNGADIFTTGDGEDMLIGRAGDDTLDGGGDTDTAYYDGNVADYTVTATTDADGRATGFTAITDNNAADGDEGTDTLIDVELLQFADGGMDASAAVHVFDAGNVLTGTFDNIEDAVAAATSGSTLRVGSGDVNIENGAPDGQVVIDKDISIVGLGAGTTTLKVNANTGTSGDARGTLVVNDGITFNMSDLTMDGTGFDVWQAVRHKGSGVFDSVSFENIGYNPSTTYQGTAIAVFGNNSDVDVIDSNFANIGRIGVLYYGANTTGTFQGNTYIGKGDGDHLDYALDISAGADVDVIDNTISDNRGVASSDGSVSAGALVSTFFAAGTNAEFSGNSFADNANGVYFGFDATDMSSGSFTGSNSFTGSGTGVRVLGNGAVSGTDSISGDASTVNWDGGSLGNTIVGAGLDDMLSGAEGNDTITGGLGDDSYTGGDGHDTAVVADAGGAAFDTLGIDFSGVTASGGAASGTLIGPDGTETLDGIEVIKVANTGSSTFIVVEGMSIQAAIDAAENGDTIVVGAGAFTEDLDVNKDITIEGANAGIAFDGTRGAETEITGSMLVTADGATIDGISLLEGGTELGEGVGIYVNAAGVTVANSILDGTDGAKPNRGIITPYGDGADLTVTGSDFNGWNTGIFLNGQDSGILISNNDFDGNNTGLSSDGPVTGSIIDNFFGTAGMGIGAMTGYATVDVGALVGTGNTFTRPNADIGIYALSAAPQALIGTIHKDYVFDNAQANTIMTGDGNDIIVSGLGNDTIDGGAGIDTLDLSNATNSVGVNLGNNPLSPLAVGTGFATGGDIGIDGLTGIENIRGGQGADGLTGDGGDNVFYASAGNDTISGAGGTDTYDASDQADAVDIDLVAGTASGAGVGTDQLTGITNALSGDGDDSFSGGTADNGYDGGDGDDTAIIGDALANATVTHSAGVTTVVSADGTDTYTNVENIQFSDQTVSIFTEGDTASTDEDTSTNGSVLGNDFDLALGSGDLSVTEVDGTPIGAGITLASGAIVNMLSDGTFTYDPNGAFEALNEGEAGSDSFTYTVEDGDGNETTETVTIDLTGVNDAPDPMASYDITATLVEEGDSPAFDIAGILGADIDPDAEDDASTLTYAVTAQDAAGTASVSGNGTAPMLNFAPGIGLESLNEGETQDVTVTLSATDARSEAASFDVTFRITGKNDNPVIAAGGTGDADEDGSPIVVDLSALGSDADDEDDGTTLIYSVTTQPGEGSASIVMQGGESNPTGLQFDPGADFQNLSEGETRTVQVGVTATDKQSGTSVEEFVEITVTGTNDPVSAGAPLTDTTDEDAGTFTAGVADLLANGSDVDANDTHTV